MLDRFQSEIDHLHSYMTIHRISPIELKEKKLPPSLNIQRTAGIICFEVFDYDYAQMLCDLDVPLLFVCHRSRRPRYHREPNTPVHSMP